MITAVVSTATYIPFTLLDSVGDPETSKVNADFTKSAYLVSTPATTATATVTENASGTYRISFTPTVVGIWHCTWSVTVDGETVRYEETVQVVTAAQADPVSALGSATITVNTPVALSGNVTVYQGDDHYSVDSRHLSWSTSSEGQWPDLTDASISLRTSHRAGTEFTRVPGSVVTPTGSTKQVKVELTNAETTALRSGTYDYQLIATLANAHVVTLVEAIMTVKERRG